MKSVIIVSALWLVAGCGLAETGAVAATQGASAAEQLEQAKETQQKVEADIAAAQAAQKDALAAAEAASE
jgi:hypothetical protein